MNTKFVDSLLQAFCLRENPHLAQTISKIDFLKLYQSNIRFVNGIRCIDLSSASILRDFLSYAVHSPKLIPIRFFPNTTLYDWQELIIGELIELNAGHVSVINQLDYYHLYPDDYRRIFNSLGKYSLVDLIYHHSPIADPSLPPLDISTFLPPMSFLSDFRSHLYEIYDIYSIFDWDRIMDFEKIFGTNPNKYLSPLTKYCEMILYPSPTGAKAVANFLTILVAFGKIASQDAPKVLTYLYRNLTDSPRPLGQPASIYEGVKRRPPWTMVAIYKQLIQFPVFQPKDRLEDLNILYEELNDLTNLVSNH